MKFLKDTCDFIEKLRRKRHFQCEENLPDKTLRFKGENSSTITKK